MTGLEGRVALVTGASGFLGTAIALRLFDEGAHVVVQGRSVQVLRDWIKRHAPDAGDRMLPVGGLLGGQAEAVSIVDRAVQWRGVPTLLVANASNRDLLGDVRALGIDAANARALLDVDVVGHVELAAEIVRRLEPAQQAACVFISSIYACCAPDPAVYPEGMARAPLSYAVVKAGMLAATRYLAAAWAPGMRVNAIIAGGVRHPERQSAEFVERYSGRTLLGRMATAEEIAAAVAFLGSDDASYITGHGLVVDGGYSTL